MTLISKSTAGSSFARARWIWKRYSGIQLRSLNQAGCSLTFATHHGRVNIRSIREIVRLRLSVRTASCYDSKGRAQNGGQAPPPKWNSPSLCHSGGVSSLPGLFTTSPSTGKNLRKLNNPDIDSTCTPDGHHPRTLA